MQNHLVCCLTAQSTSMVCYVSAGVSLINGPKIDSLFSGKENQIFIHAILLPSPFLRYVFISSLQESAHFRQNRR